MNPPFAPSRPRALCSPSRNGRPLTSSSRSDAFFTPLNLLVLLVVGYTVYVLLRPTPPPALPKEPPAIVFRAFNPRTLLPFTGENNTPVYVAVRGRVFDVTAGRNFYGPGGPYANFAGRDASRGLACGSFDEDMLTEDLDGPLDTLEGLGPDEMEALQGWEETFDSKYLVVGRLVPVGEEDK
ncbi:membrane-associated progesterone receptor component 1 [Colletotrichum tofieldiae]|uniref:Membrane-associated progesterone receptor component 1 n=1 Tax=Colletotrichum tofieldiae TaxID=708197 RepID=A0A166WCT4_9PEZI|nr:membrane-associated progesterone receptor component 1 [Colletotrichum tofieldiae]GKT54703.1 membrane-associated progesterone receptor component 1 [Colletotrichum tofieldiae]GKT76012.1 membrane-associated progesterone receptor component 1 [Colletotrichum tofieldiae]GKT83732.1 membrane-associated progesterone receptor component 1 [Colletotrichum tofieldiae]